MGLMRARESPRTSQDGHTFVVLNQMAIPQKPSTNGDLYITDLLRHRGWSQRPLSVNRGEVVKVLGEICAKMSGSVLLTLPINVNEDLDLPT